MRRPLSIAVAQPRCVARDVAANASIHAAVVCSAGARLIVFPELSLTGYELDAPAIRHDDARLEPIVDACRQTNSIALVGAPLTGDFIAMLAIDGNAASVAYRKVYVDETESRFTSGPCSEVLEVDSWRLGLAICKDTGIPQHWAETAALGIDAYVGGIVMYPDELSKIEDRARRIATTHRVWVAFASFAGPTGSGYRQTAGGSGIWSPSGEPVARAGADPGSIARATLGID